MNLARILTHCFINIILQSMCRSHVVISYLLVLRLKFCMNFSSLTCILHDCLSHSSWFDHPTNHEDASFHEDAWRNGGIAPRTKVTSKDWNFEFGNVRLGRWGVVVEEELCPGIYLHFGKSTESLRMVVWL